MEELELTPVELMSALNWKKSKVYYWINTGKFQTVERMGITKIVISQKDFDSLKKSTFNEKTEQYDNFSNFPQVSDNFQENHANNVTKFYEKIQNSFYEEQLEQQREFFQTTLETVRQMHIAASQNYNNSLKLLTDGQTEIEKENLRLQAECKSAQLKLNETELEYKKVSDNLKQTELEKNEQFKKFEKIKKVQKYSIIVLIILLLFSLVFIFTISNNSKQNEKAQIEKSQPETVQVNTKK